MTHLILKLFMFLDILAARLSWGVEIDILECGVDQDVDVHVGEVPQNIYPWLGVLYYTFNDNGAERRAVTTVALIQEEFVIAPAADIGPMPKADFRKNSRVLLGQDWEKDGRKIRNYVIHPEYGQTFNTLALVHLREPVRDIWIRPLCPPPERLISPDLYLVKFKEDITELQKEVIPMGHVPSELCKEFYVRANLDMVRMRPPVTACASTLREQSVCVWGAGSALATRDVWGRWQLLGIGTRGPGCGAPSRYLDIMAYMPWVTDSLDQFRQLTISRMSSQSYVLRQGARSYQRFGACDEEEKSNLIFREFIRLRTDNPIYQFLTYNLTILENVEYSCLTLELKNASASSEMRVFHYCHNADGNTPCYKFVRSVFDISVFIMFSDSCIFDMNAWGTRKSMTLIDPQEYRLEEGTLYKDFAVDYEEYKGPVWATQTGFEPLDLRVWAPQFDLWTTTPFFNGSTTTTTPLPELSDHVPELLILSNYYFQYIPTTSDAAVVVATWSRGTTTRFGKKKKFRRKTTTELPLATLIPRGFLFPQLGLSNTSEYKFHQYD